MKKAFASIVAILALSSVAFAGGNYKLDVKAPASAKKGEKATTTVHVNATGDFHINTEYPSKLTVTAPSGVKLEKAKLEKADAKKLDKDGLDFAVEFTASETGKKSFTGELKFATCKTTDCAPQTEKIAFDVDVK
jgi:predicted small lipoprotein YifL